MNDNIFMRDAKPCVCGTIPEMEKWGIWYIVSCSNCGMESQADLGQSGAVEAWNTFMGLQVSKEQR